MNADLKESIKKIVDTHGFEELKKAVDTLAPLYENRKLLAVAQHGKVTLRKNTQLHSITPDDIVEIAAHYKVSNGFVSYQYECLINYCESKGKLYKDYKAALRNFVIRSLGQMAQDKQNIAKKGGIDARGL